MTLKEALKSALSILKQVMEEKLNSTNVEVATVTPDKLFHMFTKEEVEEVLLLTYSVAAPQVSVSFPTMGEAASEAIKKLADAITSLQDTLRTLPNNSNNSQKSPDDPSFDVKAAVKFLTSKKNTVKNRRDFNEICELEILFRFYDKLLPSERSFFHERVRLLVIALQYNWRVAAANASGTSVPGISVHSTHLFRRRQYYENSFLKPLRASSNK